jgi:phage tail sheath protein FI
MCATSLAAVRSVAIPGLVGVEGDGGAESRIVIVHQPVLLTNGTSRFFTLIQCSVLDANCNRLQSKGN